MSQSDWLMRSHRTHRAHYFQPNSGMFVALFDLAVPDAGPNTKSGLDGIGPSWLLDCDGMGVSKSPFLAIQYLASAFSIGRPSNDSGVFGCTMLSLRSVESECATITGTAFLGRVGMPFWGMDWLTRLYCRQVLMASSRTATLWTALVRCSLTSVDSPAKNSRTPSLKLDEW